MTKDLTKAHSPYNPNTSLQLKIRKDGTIFGRWVNVNKDTDIRSLEKAFESLVQEDFPQGLEKVLSDNQAVNAFINFREAPPLNELSPDDIKTYYKFLSYLLGIRHLLPEHDIINRDNYDIIQMTDSIYNIEFGNEKATHSMIVENNRGKISFTSSIISLNVTDVKYPSFIMLYSMSSFLKMLYEIDKRIIPGVSMHATTNSEFVGVGVWPYKGAIIHHNEFIGFTYLEDTLRSMFVDEDVNRFLDKVTLTIGLPVNEYYSIHPHYIDALSAEFRWINDKVKQRMLSYYRFLANASNPKTRIVRQKVLEKLQQSDKASLRDILKFESMMIEVLVVDPHKVYRVYSAFNFA